MSTFSNLLRCLLLLILWSTVKNISCTFERNMFVCVCVHKVSIWFTVLFKVSVYFLLGGLFVGISGQIESITTFFLNLFIFTWRIISLQYCIALCHTSIWISHRCIYIYILPPDPIPLGHHRTPNLSTLSHTANSHWLSILHIVVYTFSCYSVYSLHPLLSPTP